MFWIKFEGIFVDFPIYILQHHENIMIYFAIVKQRVHLTRQNAIYSVYSYQGKWLWFCPKQITSYEDITQVKTMFRRRF